MRRWMGICLLCLICLLTACGRKEAETTAWTAEQMVQAVLESQGTVEETETIAWGDSLFQTYAADYYGLKTEDLSGGAAAYAGGVSALEVAVLRLADGADAAGIVQTLEDYIDSRAGAFAGYAPEQYAILEGAKAVSRGQYAALLICPDMSAAEAAFSACFTSEPPESKEAEPAPEPEPGPTPGPEPESIEPAQPEPEEPSDSSEPETEETTEADEPAEPEPADPDEPDVPPVQTPTEEPAAQPEPEIEPEPVPEPAPEPASEPAPKGPWSYDEQRILDAWDSGSRDGLWEQDLAILDVLESIPALTDSSLTDYQRELALHDWMIAWAEYDPGALSSGPRGEPMPDNDNPYGFLTGKKGICLGYTSTFQLMMDLCGIECVSVHGMSHSGTEEHAWNLVKLDGEWYAVDTTWDDPVASFRVPDSMAHAYFNVTDDHLRKNDHQWDEDAVPAATGTDWKWKNSENF